MEKGRSTSTDQLSTKSSLGGKELDRKGHLDHVRNEKIKELDQPEHEIVAGVDAERDFEAVVEDDPPRKSEDIDPYLVTWKNADDPANPRNWSFKRKWAAVFVVSSFTFISPVSSSMVAPALPLLGRDLGIKTEFETAMVLSIFVLAYAIGPLFFAPLSEVYGRVRVLQLSNLLYFAFNLGCAFAQTGGQMLAFRFWAGFGGSAMLALGGGILSDCFVAEQRGQAIALYMMGPVLGPAVGPIAGGFIAEYTTWRWVFWSTTILCAVVQLSGLFCLQETYAPVLLQREASKLRLETGNNAYYTEYDTPSSSFVMRLSTALVRPFRLLFTQPIVQVLAAYQLFLYGTLYILFSTFPTLWTNRYHERVHIAGLNYISLGIGFWFGAQITAPLNDRIYRRLKRKNGNVGKPEFRVPLMFVGSILCPIGLFIYGWGAEARTHWIVPNIGGLCFAAGMIISHTCSQTYIIDSYTRYAASGTAAVVVLRSLAGFAFPLFAPYMYQKLGYGWGNSVLGFISIALGIPAPIMFWKYGERLRSVSQYASGGI